MTGRPTSLTAEVQATIIEAIRGGNYKHVAAAAAGIHRDTVNEWEHRGARGEEPYASFSDELKKAEAEAEIACIATVRLGGEGWQSSAWAAERRWPSRWSGRVRITVNEELSNVLKRIEQKLDPETFAKVVDATREDAATGSAAKH